MKARFALVAGLVIGALLSGGVASAYWSNGSTGSGDGTASVAQGNDKPITIVLTSNTTGLTPGKSVAIGGVFNNPNNGYDNGRVLVRTVTVTIAGVRLAPGVNNPRCTCTVGDFTLSKPTTNVNAVIPGGTHVGHWGGDITLTMRNDPRRDQGACHGATVLLHFVSN